MNTASLPALVQLSLRYGLLQSLSELEIRLLKCVDVLNVAGTLLLSEVTLALHLLQPPLQILDQHHCLTQLLVHRLILSSQGKRLQE